MTADAETHERTGSGLPAGWLRRSLRASLFEGMLAEMVASCAGGALIIAWAVQLGCSPFMLALFGALPFLCQPVHLPSAWFSRGRDRRRLALITLTSSRQLLLGLAVLPLLPVSAATQRALFATLVTLSSLLGVVGNNAWMSWMGDLVPRRLQTRYFARRATWSTAAGALGALAAGLALDLARRRGHCSAALVVLSVVAWLAGMVCTYLLNRQADPGPGAASGGPGVEDIRQPWRCRQARLVLAYLLLWNAAIGLAASFFGLFLLRDLRASFSFIAIHGAVLAGVRALATPLWGHALGCVGTRPVLAATSFGIALVPLLWLTSAPHGFVGPLAIEAAVSGLLWAGHGLAAFHLPLVFSPTPTARPFYFAAFAATGGAAFALAGLAGGALLPLLPAHFRLLGLQFSPLHGIFVLSALLRLMAWAVSLFVHEPGAAERGDCSPPHGISVRASTSAFTSA